MAAKFSQSSCLTPIVAVSRKRSTSVLGFLFVSIMAGLFSSQASASPLPDPESEETSNHLRFWPLNNPKYLSSFGESFYLSKFANPQNFYPETALEWGRDRYGIASVLFGSALNRTNLPFGRDRLLVHRERFAPGCFSFQFISGDGNLTVVTLAQSAVSGDDIRDTSIPVVKALGHGEHLALGPAIGIQCESLECPVLCAFDTYSVGPITLRPIMKVFAKSDRVRFRQIEKEHLKWSFHCGPEVNSTVVTEPTCARTGADY